MPNPSNPKSASFDLDKQAENRFLLFRLGAEMYGTPLLEVREIIERQAYKAIPHVMPYFLGVINLRGQITGVIDLRRRFDIPAADLDTQVLMVFDTENGMMGGLVDKVEAVVTIAPEELDVDPHVATKVPLDFLAGIAKHGDDLVTVLNLRGLLSADEFVKLRSFKKSA